MEHRKDVGLDSLELKALSVPSSLLFLLGIEYDVLLCVTETKSDSFTLHFPPFAGTFKKLLELCAARFALQYKEEEDGSSVLSGAAVMPLLRYADYLPGALHVAEILDCLGAQPPSAPTRTPGSEPDGSDFQASFLDYSEFVSDASLNDVHGMGFYLTIEHGLSMATHSHLISIRFHSDWDPKEALHEFMDFSGWEKFDMRFYDESDKKQGGIIVMPTIQDVCDLLEMYEDEDSDDEGDLLPFILRPVCPLVQVPSVEDSTLRKMREQHWDTIEAFWSRFTRSRYTVVVYNLYENATLAEVIAFFDGIAIASAEMVADSSPKQRRRAFLTLANSEATRAALALDGKSTKGRTIRVQVSPPYISPDRRGHVLSTEEQTSTSKADRTQSQRARSPPEKPAAAAEEPRTSKSVTPAHGPTIPAPRTKTTTATSTNTADEKKTASAPPPVFAEPAKAVPTPVAVEKVVPTSSSVPAATTTTAASGLNIPLPASKGGHHLAASKEEAAGRAAAQSMNASAKEFVPHFGLNVNSPEFVPQAFPLPPPPPTYVDAMVTPNGGFLPAPHSAILGAMPEEMEPLAGYALPPPYQPSFFGGGQPGLPPPPPPPPPY